MTSFYSLVRLVAFIAATSVCICDGASLRLVQEDDDIRVELTQELVKAFLQPLVEAELGEEEARLLSIDFDQLRGASCQQGSNFYSCCVSVNLLSQHSGCVKITFLEKSLGVDLAILLDNRVIFHKTVTAKDPPEFCVPVPLVPSSSLCVKLYDLQIHPNGVSGCIKLKAVMFGVTLMNFDLGCFKLPPGGLHKTEVLASDDDTGLKQNRVFQIFPALIVSSSKNQRFPKSPMRQPLMKWYLV